MITAEDVRMAMVREDLRFMDANAPTESPILLSIAKAITAAQLHPDIEALVLCRSRDELHIVTATLARMSFSLPGCHVDGERHTLEFSNGSAVRVSVEAATGGNRT